MDFLWLYWISILLSSGHVVTALASSAVCDKTTSSFTRFRAHTTSPVQIGQKAGQNGQPNYLNLRSRHLRSSSSSSTSTSLNAANPLSIASSLILRGGANAATETAAISSTISKLKSLASKWNTSPQTLFNTNLLALAFVTVAAKLLQQASSSVAAKSSKTKTAATTTDGDNAAEESMDDNDNTNNTIIKQKPASVISLQRRFLAVFWLIRCADWLQGPYFYEVYAGKTINGVQASMSWVSRLFLTGFASTALFGPLVGRASDVYGRKKATLAFCVIYAAGAMSTKSNLLAMLFFGRVLSGIGTSLLFSAPEAWLVGAATNDPDNEGAGEYLGETFGLAYAGDAIVAIVAGQMASFAASRRGPTGPFEWSTVFLAAGGLLASILWKENKAISSINAKTEDNTNNSNGTDSNKSDGGDQATIRDAMSVILKDNKIMLVGAVQALFEASMYIFVLQWPPALSRAISAAFPNASSTPYGTIFSCFMACCLLGSTLFGQLSKWSVPTENFTAGMLSAATISMIAATSSVGAAKPTLRAIISAFFVFEACVGMYFPSIGTLRSRYIPDSHRSLIMNIFGIPLNILVVTVFLSIQRLGVQGALSIASGALGLAAICMFQLRRTVLMDKKRLGKA